MTKPIIVVRTFSVRTPQQLTVTARHIAATASDWMQRAAKEMADRLLTTKPFFHADYDPRTHFGYDVWHEGKESVVYYYGQASDLLPYLDLTENERESLLLETRKETAAGNQVIVFAHRRYDHTPTTPIRPQASTLSCDGALSVRYGLPHTV